MNAESNLKRQLANVALLAALACLLSSPAAAQSEGDATAGRAVAEERCAFCHGPDGNGNKGASIFQRGDVPRIASLPEAYIGKSLREYKREQRSNVTMQENAEGLSDQDMRNVAAWYASQPLSATASYEYKTEFQVE